MVPRPGRMMTILLILILGRLGRTAVRAAKPDSPYSATRPAPAEHVAELSHDLLARSAHARFDESFLAGHGLLAKSNMALRGREKESADERPRATRSGSSHDSTACTRPAGDGGLCGGQSDGMPGESDSAPAQSATVRGQEDVCLWVARKKTHAAAGEQQSWPPSMPCTYDAADVGTEADTPARSDDGTTMEQRWASFAAPNSAAKQAKLPQQSAPDNANFLEFACNVSSVFSPPTFNTSNVRGNAELSEIPWLLYDFVQFLFGVLLPFVYGILKRCGARVLFEMLINTHIDIAVPLVSILFSAMGAIIFVGEDNVRKRRRRETPLVNVLMIGIDVGLTMAWWVSLPFLFLAFPFVIVWRLLVVMWRIICIVDRIAYALGMLLGGLALIVYGGLRRIAIDGFYLVVRVFDVPYNDLDVAAHVYMMTASSDSDWDARKYPMSRPYWGKRGVDFENFVRDFGAALAGKGDDDASRSLLMTEQR